MEECKSDKCKSDKCKIALDENDPVVQEQNVVKINEKIFYLDKGNKIITNVTHCLANYKSDRVQEIFSDFNGEKVRLYETLHFFDILSAHYVYEYQLKLFFFPI